LLYTEGRIIHLILPFFHLRAVTKLSQADHLVRVPFVRLIFVDAEQPVPPGQVEPEFAVGLLNEHRVMDPVHIRRNYQRPERLVDYNSVWPID
jgi:hypothetical protein